MIAAKINNTVAIMERIENRLIPHTPCPLVHPLPIFVPIPTSSPPIIIMGVDDVIKKGMELFEKNIKINGPNINPNKIPFRIPSGISLVKIDPKTGMITKNSEGILESFLIGTEPYNKNNLLKLDDLGTINNNSISGTGSLLLN